MVNYNIRGNSYMEIASNIFIVKIAEKMFVKKMQSFVFYVLMWRIYSFLGTTICSLRCSP